MRLMQAALVGFLVLGLVACQKKQTRPDEQGAGATSPGGGVSTTGVDGSTTGQASDLATAQQQALAALKTRSVIYF